jgi:hypothetical protein
VSRQAQTGIPARVVNTGNGRAAFRFAGEPWRGSATLLSMLLDVPAQSRWRDVKGSIRSELQWEARTLPTAQAEPHTCITPRHLHGIGCRPSASVPQNPTGGHSNWWQRTAPASTRPSWTSISRAHSFILSPMRSPSRSSSTPSTTRRLFQATARELKRLWRRTSYKKTLCRHRVLLQSYATWR